MSVPRVYTLGSAPLVYLMSHELASLSFQPKVPEIVLLLQDQKKLNRFLENESKLVIRSRGGGADYSCQYMASCSPPKFASGDLAKLDNLVVGEKKPRASIQALKKYSRSLHSDTNVLLLNPAMGLLDLLRKNIWNERGFVPNLFIGVTNTSGFCRPKEFTAELPNFQNTLQICSVPRTHEGYTYEGDVQGAAMAMESNNLLKLFAAVNQEQSGSGLGIVCRPYGDVLLYRLEQLIVQSCVNPIMALYGAQAHDLMTSESLVKMTRALITEFVHVLKSTDKFINNIPYSQGALDAERLLAAVARYCKSYNSKAFNELNVHDVNQLNGFFALKARRRNIRCPLNDAIMACSKAKLELARNARLDFRYL
ncbi:LADA_0C00760g1_1 [Lachancea dasiensis]|uniref:LADA_0C00760g1_1 n=1 Tax=Lachancea dasiensis TaxID=1072105 RepID=A0A1G4IXU3_9SACH|nr:LADA_0C00760g1_1 [Lachancea dasiensis]